MGRTSRRLQVRIGEHIPKYVRNLSAPLEAKVRNLLDCIDEIENKLKCVDTKIEELQSTFERRFENIENKLNQNECKINEDMEDKIKTIEMNFTENNESNKQNLKRVTTLEEKINHQNELSDKEKRIKNIILYNVPESSSGVVNERIAGDCKILKEIFERKSFTMISEKIDTFFRLG